MGGGNSFVLSLPFSFQMGVKRASPGADEGKSIFDVDLSDEVVEKLQAAKKDVLRVELANGTCIFLHVAFRRLDADEVFSLVCFLDCVPYTLHSNTPLTFARTLERASIKRLIPVFEKRRELIKSIPKFWPVALMNNAATAVHIQHADDQKALGYLEDIWVTRSEAEHRAFVIEFVSVS